MNLFVDDQNITERAFEHVARSRNDGTIRNMLDMASKNYIDIHIDEDVR